MNLGQVEDYAVRALVDLAHHPETRVADIAKRTGAPVAHLAKVVQSLVRAGLAETTRGRTGGVRLTRAPQEITLREALEAVQGPIRVQRCPRRGAGCPRNPDCPVFNLWKDLETGIRQQLERVRVADLLVNCGDV